MFNNINIGSGDMEIGHKIKELRLKNGLTLEELASRSELTKGFLSQLERDLTSPSISTLADVLEALGTNLSEFFQSPQEEQIVFKESDFFIDKRDNYKIEWIIPNAQKNQMEPILLTIYPKMKSTKLKSHEGQEFGYVLKGPVYLVMDDRRMKLNTNETFYITNGKTYYLQNQSDHHIKVLWVSSPPVF